VCSQVTNNLRSTLVFTRCKYRTTRRIPRAKIDELRSIGGAHASLIVSQVLTAHCDSLRADKSLPAHSIRHRIDSLNAPRKAMAAEQHHLGHVDAICRISGGGVIAAELGKQLPRLASSREQLQPSQAAFLDGHDTVVIATPNVEQV
jgi:hypothetical protein